MLVVRNNICSNVEQYACIGHPLRMILINITTVRSLFMSFISNTELAREAFELYLFTLTKSFIKSENLTPLVREQITTEEKT